STYATQQAGGYADAGEYGKAFATAYAGGYTSSRVNGANGVRGGVTASLQLSLKVAMDAYSNQQSTLDPASGGASVKSAAEGVRNGDISNTGAEITISPLNRRADEFIDTPLADLNQEQLAYLSQ